MKLNSSSPELLTEWAEMCLGTSLLVEDGQKLVSTLRARDRFFKQRVAKFISSPIPDTIILAVPDALLRPRYYYFSERGGPFYEAGELTSKVTDAQRQRYLQDKIENHREQKERCLRAGRIPWTNAQRFNGQTQGDITTRAAEIADNILKSALTYWRKKVQDELAGDRYHLRRQETYQSSSAEEQQQNQERLIQQAREKFQKGEIKLREGLPELRMLLRQRWRAPERKILRRIASCLDSGALTAMRSIHLIDNNLYAWLVDAPDEISCKRRQDFCRSYPILMPFTFHDPVIAIQLGALADSGELLTGGRQLAKLAEILAEPLGAQLSLPTLVKFLTVKPWQAEPGYAKGLTDTIAQLDKLPVQDWPKTTEDLYVFKRTVYGIQDLPQGLGKSLNKRLLEDVEGNWKAFSDKSAATLPAGPASRHLHGAISRLETFVEVLYERVIMVDRLHTTGFIPQLSPTEAKKEQASLLASFPLLDWLRASETWNQPRVRLASELKILALGKADEAFCRRVPLEWLPLIHPMSLIRGARHEKRRLAGIQIEELTSRLEIEASGLQSDRLEASCLSQPHDRTRHIFRLRDEKNRLDGIITILAIYRPDGPLYLVEANQEKVVTPRFVAAGQYLITALNDGTLSEVSNHQSRRRVLDQMAATGAERRLGFDIQRPDAFRVYQALFAKFLPCSWDELVGATTKPNFIADKPSGAAELRGQFVAPYLSLVLKEP